MVPATTCFIGIVICATEGWSVYEKAEDKQRRKMAEMATKAIELTDKDALRDIISEAIRKANSK